MKTFTEKLMGFVEKRDAAARSYRKCTTWPPRYEINCTWVARLCTSVESVTT